MIRCRISALAITLVLGGFGLQAAAGEFPDQDYLVYVVSESADKIAIVRFGPSGISLDNELSTGMMPADKDGPHGVDVSPDKRFYYVSLAHGRPFGSVWKYSASDNRMLGQVTLGMFPATLDVTPDGAFFFAVNFNLHGDMVPSSVSAVATEAMMEVARIPTCTMPHGSRINPQGTRHYSACMMDDMIVEIDTRAFKVSRHFVLTEEKGRIGPPEQGTHNMSVSCSPTWAQPGMDGAYVYAACNKSDEIIEIDYDTWRISRRFPAGAGVYNLAVTNDRRLIATNKRGQSVSVFDLKTGREIARLPTKRKVVHGAVVSPDDRFAFISVEGVGAEPGTVEVIDLAALKTVATMDVPPQASGIDFWKIEPARSN